jgi:hypothetical protein
MGAHPLTTRELGGKGELPGRRTDLATGTRVFRRGMPAEPDLPRRLAAVVTLLARAREEYERAVAAGAIREPLEYHGSRGLYLLARQAFERIADALRPKAPEVVAAIAAELDRLSPVWPVCERPKGPPMVPCEVAAAVARIERSAGRLARVP